MKTLKQLREFGLVVFTLALFPLGWAVIDTNSFVLLCIWTLVVLIVVALYSLDNKTQPNLELPKETLHGKKCESCSFIDTAPTDEPCANCRYLHTEE